MTWGCSTSLASQTAGTLTVTRLLLFWKETPEVSKIQDTFSADSGHTVVAKCQLKVLFLPSPSMSILFSGGIHGRSSTTIHDVLRCCDLLRADGTQPSQPWHAPLWKSIWGSVSITVHVHPSCSVTSSDKLKIHSPSSKWYHLGGNYIQTTFNRYLLFLNLVRYDKFSMAVDSELVEFGCMLSIVKEISAEVWKQVHMLQSCGVTCWFLMIWLYEFLL